ncbi:predicted protein [Sclerotinia sclerotiorum 1980 UF-70]|uniref:Uncharacterized protein n=1 Tax=Sclerotinia sclerotiorum (strain ATCC 18683 / 1980 / Ss-1) TaxID=665079 RepID=A7E8R2_SCLS1|nr:predicted protein [Sclerotinia sclerotiorum 1980 UF-70]EDN96764.1 predicted protein [Sclerotinia sclerotiorum 1980 UF-70]
MNLAGRATNWTSPALKRSTVNAGKGFGCSSTFDVFTRSDKR